jgi:hypothetical protein
VHNLYVDGVVVSSGADTTTALFDWFCGMEVVSQWRTEWGFGGFKPPSAEIPKFWQSRTGLQIERKMFNVPIPTS